MAGFRALPEALPAGWFALIAPPRQASARSPHSQGPILKQKLMGYSKKTGIFPKSGLIFSSSSRRGNLFDEEKR
jgi:hypothetical protein